jgi:cellulose biosynthesis protein BcsQ
MKHVLTITGPPGSGKSTVLRTVARGFAVDGGLRVAFVDADHVPGSLEPFFRNTEVSVLHTRSGDHLWPFLAKLAEGFDVIAVDIPHLTQADADELAAVARERDCSFILTRQTNRKPEAGE